MSRMIQKIGGGLVAMAVMTGAVRAADTAGVSHSMTYTRYHNAVSTSDGRRPQMLYRYSTYLNAQPVAKGPASMQGAMPVASLAVKPTTSIAVSDPAMTVKPVAATAVGEVDRMIATELQRSN
ncbi:MAG: hypothetical protein GC162_06240 [Planctomycetes bacterium]|nr:hypothetical protein [Planctomycetota bacterium]